MTVEVSTRAVSHISHFGTLCNSWQLDNISDIWELICKKGWWNEAILSYKHKSNDIFQLCRSLFIEWKLCNYVYSFNCHYKVFPTYNSYLINEPNHQFRRFSKTLEQVIVLEKCLKQMNNEKLYLTQAKKSKPWRYSALHMLEFVETSSRAKYFFLLQQQTFMCNHSQTFAQFSTSQPPYLEVLWSTYASQGNL